MGTIFSVEAKKKQFDCYIKLVTYVYVFCGLLRHGLFPLLVVMCGLCYYYLGRTIIKYKQQHNQEEKSKSRWSNNYLPQEMMELILMRLCRDDYLSVQAVCSPWRATVARIISEERCPPTDHHLPALLMLNQTSMDHHTLLKLQFNTTNPMGGLRLSDDDGISSRVLPKSCHNEDLSMQYCCGSIGGWLIITDHSFMSRPDETFFYNPVSRAKVTLPSFQCGGYGIFKMVVASSVPNNPHCIVAALSGVGDLAFCRPSDHDNNNWTLLYDKKKMMGEEFKFVSIAIHDGKLYAMTHKADHMSSVMVVVFDLLSDGDDANKGGKELKIVGPRPRVRETCTFWDHVFNVTSTSPLHLVSDFDRGELLLIVQTTNCTYHRDGSFVDDSMVLDLIRPPITEMFQVFRLDESGPDGAQWVQLETLGDRILFITNRSCMCVSASAIGNNYVHERGLIEGNLIYFALDSTTNCKASPSLGCDLGVFSLTDESIRRNLLNQTIPRSWASHSPIWFTPDLW